MCIRDSDLREDEAGRHLAPRECGAGVVAGAPVRPVVAPHGEDAALQGAQRPGDHLEDGVQSAPLPAPTLAHGALAGHGCQVPVPGHLVIQPDAQDGVPVDELHAVEVKRQREGPVPRLRDRVLL
eukprot:13412474-Alexandrium_andersonii.AAC.1